MKSLWPFDGEFLFSHSLVVSSLLTFPTFRLIFLFGSSLPWIFVPHLDYITILFPDKFVQKSENHFRTKPLRYSKLKMRFFVLWFENAFLTRNKDKQKECDKLKITCWIRNKLKPKLIQSRTCLSVSLPRFLCHLIDVWIWCKIYWYLKYSHSETFHPLKCENRMFESLQPNRPFHSGMNCLEWGCSMHELFVCVWMSIPQSFRHCIVRVQHHFRNRISCAHLVACITSVSFNWPFSTQQVANSKWHVIRWRQLDTYYLLCNW